MSKFLLLFIIMLVQYYVGFYFGMRYARRKIERINEENRHWDLNEYSFHVYNQYETPEEK